MFCQEVSSVLLSDKFGNDTLCSILFPSLGFNVLMDYFYQIPSCCQQGRNSDSKRLLSKAFP